MSPCSSYIFAAGQDRRIRAWSLRTGDPILPTSPLSSKMYDDDYSELLHQHFAEPVSAMQVTYGGGDSATTSGGLSLWALSGKKMYRYWLGQRTHSFAAD